jgi:Peptidase family M1 domain
MTLRNSWSSAALGLLIVLCALGNLTAQDKPYFQQEVNYTINATLDDKTHMLTGQIEWEYINHSPDRLTQMWVHVWPNAFKNRTSAFCKQQLRQGNRGFYFADEKDLGYIKGLDFQVNGQKATWAYDPQHPDIAILTLATPLEPGGRLRVSTPFVEKIPASFSRLGHVGTSYQMTQWFPKPAVYDNRGWHPMPYLNQGEFYSEFGSFDVTLTLPDNYVVGATGTLQTASEVAFLTRKVADTQAEVAKRATNEGTDTPESKKKKEKKSATRAKGSGGLDSFPESSTTMKTIRYTAENVHDFAWFADKRFYVLRDTARLINGKSVDCWAMFTASDFDLWTKGAFYVKRSVEAYSEWVGAYPYPQATAVHSALSAGGGMEYPMITVIGDANSAKSLDNVITHEVGHNWFYGILATNERDYPWMDEGMNSYYENRYMRKYYGGDSYAGVIPEKIYDSKKYGGLMETALNLTARNGLDQPALNSDGLTNTNYGLQSYMKTTACMYWLENAVGTEVMDRAMQSYYKKWSFKHPYPTDYAAVMQSEGVEISWFMQQMETRKQYDPALRSVKRNSDGTWALGIRQRGDNNGPVAVTALKDGQPLNTQWYQPKADEKSFIAPFPATEADRFVVDYERKTFDVNRKNNTRRTKGLFPGIEPIKISPFAPIQRADRSTLGITPWLGWNNYDQLMVGAVLYNPPVPGQRFQYYLAPGFALGTKELTGIYDVRWRIHPVDGAVQRITIGVDGRSFHNDARTYLPTGEEFNTRFSRITPSVKIDFRSGARTHIDQQIALKWHFLSEETNNPTTDNKVRLEGTRNQIQELTYALDNHKSPNPWHLRAGLERQAWEDNDANEQYLRANLEWRQAFYYQKKRKIRVRGYAGYMIENTNRDRKTLGFGANDLTRGSMSLAQNGYTDYKNQLTYFNRNGQSGLMARQVYMSEGGFKYSFGSAEASSAGHSNNFVAALNLTADLPKRLPFGLPLQPYFDMGYATLGHVPSGGEEPSPVFWSGGFALGFFDNNFNIYFPAISSSNINDLYKRTSGGSSFRNYLNRITWSVNLRGLEPMDVIKAQLPR